MFYSYRTRYSGLLASPFLSSREILFKELTHLNPAFSCMSFVLIEFDLGGFSLLIFLYRVSNLYPKTYDIDY